jgi:hypothetical protein
MSPTPPAVSRFTFGRDTVATAPWPSSDLVIDASEALLGSAHDADPDGGSRAVIVSLPPW